MPADEGRVPADSPPRLTPAPPSPPVTTRRRLGEEADYQRWIRDQPSSAEPSRSRLEPDTAARTAGRFDDLVLTESSLAESALVATSRSVIGPVARAGARPVWSERDGLWLLRDRHNGRWYRHDPAADQWVPLDEN